MGKPEYTGPRHTCWHPKLGALTGRLIQSKHFPEHRVVQFRSIPYATVPKRFLPSVRLAEIPDNFDGRPYRDFTNFGAACPQTGPEVLGFFESYGGMLEDDYGVEYNEFTCLNLTISIPESQFASSQKEKLPVLVYIHGGGAKEGIAHVDGLHSNAPITSYAASIGQPIITVNVGYRLGWFSGLVCHDLLTEFETSPSSVHGPFNLALQDQRNAFAWINEFISGFGGDPLNITAFGESAGSTFLTYHICGSSTRLFDRAILQSGLAFGDLPLEAKDMGYQGMLQYFSIKGSTASERLDALRLIDPQILALIPDVHLIPYMGPVPGVKTEDSLFSRGPVTVLSQIDLISNCDWLGDLIIGDDFWEGHVFFPLIKQLPQFDFVAAVRSAFPSPHAEALLAVYDISASEKMDANRVWKQISLFMGDLMFSVGYHTLSSALTKRKERNVYRYSFALSNPFPGSFHSFITGHHFVEILYIFLTLLDRYPTHRHNWIAHQAQETARRWITFANGRPPWEPLAVTDGEDVGAAKIAICDDLRGWTVRTMGEDEELSKLDPWGERRYDGWRAFVAAFDALKEEGDDSSLHAQKIALAKLKIMQLAYGNGFFESSG